MPVQYEGVLAEHEAVRSGVGVFDVSHLGRFQLAGGGSTAVLRRLLCNDVGKIGAGRAQYTMALNGSGGVEDDIIVLRLDEEAYWVNPNGANYDEITGRFATEAAGQEVIGRRHDTVMLAVQGPDATEVLADVLGECPGRFRVTSTEYRGATVITSGTGYTGERGGEVIAPAEVGETLFGALVEKGAVPCGLGARDTLRLEMGYPLWGQDLDEHTTPLEAGLGWVVDWDHEFLGRTALQRQRDEGIGKQLIGFVTDSRRFPRHGYPARAGASVGAVASGNFSPTLEMGIGMAYLEPPPAETDAVEVEIRGEWVEVRRADPPFIDR